MTEVDMLEVTDLKIGYKKSSPILERISFTISEGELILLCGPNGSGKSTLLKTIAGETKPLGGTIRGLGKTDMAMIPTGIPKVKGFTLREFVRTSCYQESDWAGRLSRSTENKIEEALSAIGVGSLSENDISTLSDGEFQKGCIAVAIAREARLILLDEPTAFLDVPSRAGVLGTLISITKDKPVSVIFSSHDIYDGVKASSRVFAISGSGLFTSTGPSASESERRRLVSDCFGGRLSFLGEKD